MTSKTDLYKKYEEAAWANLPSSLAEAGETYLSDDFKNFDKDGNVVADKQGYIGMSQLLTSAFTDMKRQSRMSRLYIYGEIFQIFQVVR